MVMMNHTQLLEVKLGRMAALAEQDPTKLGLVWE
jgi:hypothetical protein